MILVITKGVPYTLHQDTEELFGYRLALENRQVIVPDALYFPHRGNVHVWRRNIPHKSGPNLVVGQRAGIACQERTHRSVAHRLLLASHRHQIPIFTHFVFRTLNCNAGERHTGHRITSALIRNASPCPVPLRENACAASRRLSFLFAISMCSLTITLPSAL